MEFKIACGTWIKDDDCKVLKALEESDRWLSAEELSEITGLSTTRVKRTMKLLKVSTNHMKKRKEFIN